MSEQVPLEITTCGAEIVALLATIWHFTGVGSHVGSKVASLFARVVALGTNKGLLSAVNSCVYFQLGRSVRSVTALLANVTFFLHEKEHS